MNQFVSVLTLCKFSSFASFPAIQMLIMKMSQFRSRCFLKCRVELLKIQLMSLFVFFRYHLKTFDKVATCHYIRGSQMFHTNLIRAPALLILSKTDPIGAEPSNLRVKESWENMGMEVFRFFSRNKRELCFFVSYRCSGSVSKTPRM